MLCVNQQGFNLSNNLNVIDEPTSDCNGSNSGGTADFRVRPERIRLGRALFIFIESFHKFYYKIRRKVK